MRESKIEKYLKDRVLATGGALRKVKWGDRAGAPDRVVWYPNGVQVWVEAKASGEEPKIHQEREHERMRAMGQRVLVIDSLAGVDALIEELDEK